MTSIDLRSGQLSLTGVLWQGERNPLSPLYAYGSPEEREGARKILAGSGVLDGNGDINRGFYPLMDFLQNPSGIARICRSTFTGTKTASIYTTVNKGSAVLFSDESDSETLTKDPPVQEVLAGIGFDEVIPNNEVITLDTSMSLHEMWALAAMYDGERRSVITAIDRAASAGELAMPKGVFDADSVRSLLSSFTREPANILFLALLSGIIPPLPSGIQPNPDQILTALATKGLLQKSEKGYSVPDQQLPMIRRTAVFDTVTFVDVNRIQENGSEVAESALNIRSDGTLLWFITQKENPDRILMKYISSDNENAIIRQLAGNPPFFPGEIKVPPPAIRVLPPKKKFCSQCGAPVKPESRFCNSCGKRLD
jgi:hypothetical protein